MLFSPLALPDIDLKLKKNGKGPAEAVVWRATQRISNPRRAE
jgi:hypothetical protein